MILQSNHCKQTPKETRFNRTIFKPKRQISVRVRMESGSPGALPMKRGHSNKTVSCGSFGVLGRQDWQWVGDGPGVVGPWVMTTRTAERA
jgi:hypothetical protein